MRMHTVQLALVIAGAATAWTVGATAAPDRTEMRVRASQELVKAGRDLLAKDDAVGALAQFESALAADPKNIAAYVGMGETNGRLDRKKAELKYYEIALSIDPNDRAALAAQSMALLDLGKFGAAEQNLARLKRICTSGCREFDQVNDALAAALDATQEKLLGRDGEEKSAQKSADTPPGG